MTTHGRPGTETDIAGRWAWRLATVFGLGERLPAPGTLAGSLPAALLWLAMAAVAPSDLVLVATVVLTAAAAAAGTWAGELEARRRGHDDPGSVVVDEVAGQWLTLAVAAPWIPAGSLGVAAAAGAGFVAFRLLDVLKPWPVSQLERLPGGLGIMADDLAAGALAGAAVAAAATWLA